MSGCIVRPEVRRNRDNPKRIKNWHDDSKLTTLHFAAHSGWVQLRHLADHGEARAAGEEVERGAAARRESGEIRAGVGRGVGEESLGYSSEFLDGETHERRHIQVQLEREAADLVRTLCLS